MVTDTRTTVGVVAESAGTAMLVGDAKKSVLAISDDLASL